MSLDVYLTMKGVSGIEPGDKIFIREDGQTKEISHEEWYQRWPDREPVTVYVRGDGGEVYEANITHNLNRMAAAAGIYEYLWRPEEVGVTKAAQLIEPLRAGLERLRADPEKFEKLNPENGWGNYPGLCSFVANYLTACETYPDADVSISR